MATATKILTVEQAQAAYAEAYNKWQLACQAAERKSLRPNRVWYAGDYYADKTRTSPVTKAYDKMEACREALGRAKRAAQR